MNTRERCNQLWTEIVKTRDVFCQSCGATGYLDAHHLFPRSQGDWLILYDPDYGVGLCGQCHSKATGNPAKFREAILPRLKLLRYDWSSDFENEIQFVLFGIGPDNGEYLAATRAQKLERQMSAPVKVQSIKPNWKVIKGFLLAELENITEWRALTADCDPEYGRTII